MDEQDREAFRLPVFMAYIAAKLKTPGIYPALFSHVLL